VGDWWPPLRRCPAEAPAGEGPGAAPRWGRGGRGGGGRCVWFAERKSLRSYKGTACVPMRGRRCTQAFRPSDYSGALVRVRACLLVRAHVRTHTSASFLANITSTQIISIPTPVTAPLNTAMVSQAMVHRLGFRVGILSSLAAGQCVQSPCRYWHPSIHPPWPASIDCHQRQISASRMMHACTHAAHRPRLSV
jgi:hypothetical protein